MILLSQIPYIVRVCEAFNIPILSVPGFEADDVIGTLAVASRRSRACKPSSSRTTKT